MKNFLEELDADLSFQMAQKEPSLQVLEKLVQMSSAPENLAVREWMFDTCLAWLKGNVLGKYGLSNLAFTKYGSQFIRSLFSKLHFKLQV